MSSLFAPQLSNTAVNAAVSDLALTHALVRVELELARAAAKSQLVSAQVCSAMATFEVTPEVLQALREGASVDANPVNALVKLLRKHCGAYGAGVHVGATSQDIMDTALMLLSRESCDIMLGQARAAVVSLQQLAAQHQHTPAVARTLTQPSVPTTFGLRAGQWGMQLADAAEQVHEQSSRLGVQLGGAGGTLAASQLLCEQTLNVDAEQAAQIITEMYANMAAELGLQAEDMPWHTRRTSVLRLANSLGELAAACGKISTDVLTAVRPEIGELSGVGTGASSAMPHKVNPVLPVLVQAAVAGVPGQLSTLWHAAANAADERPPGAWQSEWLALQSLLQQVGGAVVGIKDICANLQVHPDRLLANLEAAGSGVVSEQQKILGAVAADSQPNPLTYLGQSARLASKAVEHMNAKVKDV